jgi:hypothetical protein
MWDLRRETFAPQITLSLDTVNNNNGCKTKMRANEVSNLTAQI